MWKQTSEPMSRLGYWSGGAGGHIDRIIDLLSQAKRMMDDDEIPLTRIISMITLMLFI
jgi:high-affinity K+ transport system ATPase subunit B